MIIFVAFARGRFKQKW